MILDYYNPEKEREQVRELRKKKLDDLRAAALYFGLMGSCSLVYWLWTLWWIKK